MAQQFNLPYRQLIAGLTTQQDKIYYKKSQHRLALLTLDEQLL
ncbi:hypothetical protein RNAN_3084 [Rheinheimera nanhaiensis E407-8]|uniref:Uncharacterized protein n=1 Tax=Rheinheimera nanhaiensis E407-8 TaxID=562729 RepID=I1E192_9GAMM|nr:hypothetical protein RNAN_3084 [Rheinheimera nanhaiensis E407-8]